LYSDLNRLIIEYDVIPIKSLYEKELWFPGGDCNLQRIVHDDKYLYINCSKQEQISRYSFDGNFIDIWFTKKAFAMDIVNNELYLLDDSKCWILDIKLNAIIGDWDLPKEKEGSVGGWYLKVDQKENFYFTSYRYTNHVYLYNKLGKEIKKFGKKEKSSLEGEFSNPWGLTVNEKILYVCDCSNNRVQLLDKENGNYISRLPDVQRLFDRPRSILLHFNLIYVVDWSGIQVFTSHDNTCIQTFGKCGEGEGEFQGVSGLCLVNDKLFVADQINGRILVWN